MFVSFPSIKVSEIIILDTVANVTSLSLSLSLSKVAPRVMSLSWIVNHVYPREVMQCVLLLEAAQAVVKQCRAATYYTLEANGILVPVNRPWRL
jgi:hypothetical protein